jgi:endoglucanase
MAERPPAVMTVDGVRFLDGFGKEVRLRGVCIGGWLKMENFITGYAGNQSLMRARVRSVLGDELYEFFFERLLTAFFGEDDARFLGDSGFNLVRMHWHSDNPDGAAAFWDNRQYQDRVVGIWEAIAERYRGETWVAGYNLMNEPADESRQVVGPYSKRLFDAIREIDPDHTIYLDGNTYSIEFDIFEDPPGPNTVYSLHDYVASGLGRGGLGAADAAEHHHLAPARGRACAALPGLGEGRAGGAG